MIYYVFTMRAQFAIFFVLFGRADRWHFRSRAQWKQWYCVCHRSVRSGLMMELKADITQMKCIWNRKWIESLKQETKEVKMEVASGFQTVGVARRVDNRCHTTKEFPLNEWTRDTHVRLDDEVVSYGFGALARVWKGYVTRIIEAEGSSPKTQGRFRSAGAATSVLPHTRLQYFR